MVEAVMLWNEPNNLSHWDFELDPGWVEFAQLTRLAEGHLDGPRGSRPLRTALDAVLRDEGWKPLPIESDDHA